MRLELHRRRVVPSCSLLISLAAVSLAGLADPPRSKQACEAAGGIWGRFGLMTVDQCDMPTSDAGKPCSGHAECESSCVADDSVKAGSHTRGICYHRSIVLGTCLNGVKDGIAQGVVCVD